MFDPESKVKFMLEGLANILLRNHMDGILTEYKKMKIGKFEFPFSSCEQLFADEIYSEFAREHNGDETRKLSELMEKMAKRYDDAKAAKTKKLSKAPKKFPPTRRQKIESARKTYGIARFEFVRVNTANDFYFGGRYYHIPDSCAAYEPKTTKDGDVIYDMDQILCAETVDGQTLFFDMNIEPVDGVKLIAEQIKF